MHDELNKTYSSETAESKWYPIWEQGGYFRPKKNKSNKTFSLVMPPPNVTGQLHMGHALDITTQDALVRYKRMKGYETLFIPGMDHAGISTQAKVEEKLWHESKKTRHDFSREEFLEKVWEWKKNYGGIIENQQRAMGASPDWDYFMFTMDPEANEAVNKAFVALYNQGIIYQDNRLVNWDPVLQSAISDAEVEYHDVEGHFYHILYPIKDSDKYLEVATTRPETMLGDTAVAVNPLDDRWKDFIGKTAIIPLCNREIPIIGDSYVDLKKGTGCLKVTPGHDFNDFEIGKRHGLPIINLLNKDGTLNENCLEWAGLKVTEARSKICHRLKEENQLIKMEKHLHNVGHGDRSKVVVEPLLSKQWFLNIQEMAKKAVEMVENDTTRFYPKSWENTFFSWLRGPKDWCLSRQLWWGHQIPVFTCQSCHHQWADEKKSIQCPKCEGPVKQDPDVLDTWFSSGLWPLTTLGWPSKKRMQEKGFDRFYPTSVLVTGYDIIFFWVARMMMMGIKETGKVPFEKVYIHAIVRDKLGRKMSKSLGNGIDPLEMIKLYGADALRFTLAAGSGHNRNLNMDPERIAGYRNFINKIWNAFRFIYPFLQETDATLPEKLSHHEKWILGEMNLLNQKVNRAFDDFRFDEACSDIYQFVYFKFCSWFIELSKVVLYGEEKDIKARRIKVLKYVFKQIMALLHPFTPFITEELWSHLKDQREDLLAGTSYPEYRKELEFREDQEKMEKFIQVVTKIRNLRSSMNIPPKQKVSVQLFMDDETLTDYFKKSFSSFSELGKVEQLLFGKTSAERPGKSVMEATSFTEIFLLLEGSIDLEEQSKRLQKEIQKEEKELGKMKNKIQNPKFLQNAPKEIVEEVNTKLKDTETKILSLRSNLERFNA